MLVEINKKEIEKVCEMYFDWKELNEAYEAIGEKKAVISDCISEPIGCYCLDLFWNKGESVGDASDKHSNKKYEFKAASNLKDGSIQLGPKCKFDDLVFLHFDCDKDLVYIYDLEMNSDEINGIKLNDKESVKDQKKVGRRPILNIMSKIIKPRNIKPLFIFDINKQDII